MQNTANTDLSNLSATGEAHFNNKFVNKSGDTMTGPLNIQDNDQTAGVTPTNDLSKGVYFKDKNGNPLGYIQNVYRADGSRYMLLNCRNADGSKSTSLSLGFNANGTAYVTVQNPTTSSNSQEIATTAWVHNNSATIADWSMPSGQYTELTLGATGTGYTASKTGWVVLSKKANGSNQFVEVGTGNGVRIRNVASSSTAYCVASIPVRKGASFYVSYTTGGDLDFFRLMHAVGEV